MPSSSTASPFTQDYDGVERPSKRPRTAASDSTSQVQEVGIMRKTVDDNHVSFLGSASGIHFIRSVYAAIGKKRPGQHATFHTPEGELVPGEDDQIGSEATDTAASSIWQPNEVTEDPANPGFTFDDLVIWSQSYFDHWFPAYPFLHAPSILDFFEQFASNQMQGQGGIVQTFELAILRAIISISLADRRQLGSVGLRPIPSILVFSSFKSAMESVQMVLSTPTSILSLQAVLCVQLFLLSMLRHNAASRFGGLVTRMIYQLGLHRCPARYTAFSVHELTLRKRIFWSAYCMDRHVNQSLGLPITLRDDDLDVCFLDREVHGAASMNSEIDERLVLLDLLSKHAEVKGLTMELLHKSIPHRHLNHDQSLRIQSKLAKWSNQVEEHLDIDSTDQSPLSAFHKMMLTVLKQECVIALNRPLLTPSKKSSDHNAALHTCVSAARSTITSLSNFLEPSRGDNHDEAVPLLWPSFTWAIWMSTFIIIFATIEEELPRKVATRLIHKSLDILRHLSTRGSVWPNACEIAIRELKTRLLEPNSEHSTRVETSSSHRSPTQDRPSTEDHQSRPQSSRHMLARLNSPTVVNTGERHTQRSRVDDHRSIPDSTPSDAWKPSGMFDDANTNRTYSNTVAKPVNTANAMRDPWSVQQAPDWLENATHAAADQINLFQGFEIPFWMGDDQYNNLIGNDYG